MAVGQREEAIEDLSRAVAFDVNNPELYVVRAYAYLLDGNTASSIKDFSRAIELDGKSSAALRGARSRQRSGGSIGRCLRRSQSRHRTRSALTDRLCIPGRRLQAKRPADIGSKDVETAIKLDPNSPEALWARGEIEEASGQADSAITDLRRVLQLKPSWQFAADALKRLGAPADDGDDKPQLSLDLDKWHVFQHGKDLRSDERRLSSDPRTTRNDRRGTTDAARLGRQSSRPTPVTAYCVFRADASPAKGGADDTELAAIIDIDAAQGRRDRTAASGAAGSRPGRGMAIES